MSEIEKLYENAGIKKERHCTKVNNVCSYIECAKCDYYNTIYPPFTAEKQLELIKFLLDKYYDIRIRKSSKGVYSIKSFIDISCFSEDFEETLASFTNTHLQDLTDVEKEQIRNILKVVLNRFPTHVEIYQNREK